MPNKEPSKKEIDELYIRLKKEVEERGYYLNPDVEFTKDLIKSLLINQGRYGYQACPCRLATAKKANDLDIICPCDYRDADLNEYGACFCGLYVTKEVVDGKKKISPIPERRKQGEIKMTKSTKETQTKLPIWRCKVCGYLCARDSPPDECPICHAEKERFETFRNFK